jgi:hypothetical protein
VPGLCQGGEVQLRRDTADNTPVPSTGAERRFGYEPALASAVQSDPSTVSNMGEAFCTDMSNGNVVGTEETQAVAGLLQGDPNLSSSDAGEVAPIVTSYAAQDLCPQFVPAVQVYANSGS